MNTCSIQLTGRREAPAREEGCLGGVTVPDSCASAAAGASLSEAWGGLQEPGVSAAP